MSAGRPTVRLHHEEVDDDDFRPQPPIRDQKNLDKTPAAHQGDFIPRAKEKTKELKEIFDMKAPTWNQEVKGPSAGDLPPQTSMKSHTNPTETLAGPSEFTPYTVSRAQAHNQGSNMEEKKAAARHLAATVPSTSLMAVSNRNQPDEDTKPKKRQGSFTSHCEESSTVPVAAMVLTSANHGPKRLTQSEGRCRVGAVHVPGIAGAADSLDDDTVIVLSEPPETIVAKAVASDALAIEIRNDLLNGLREEMQRHHVAVAVRQDSQDRATPPFWTKRRSHAALLLLLFIVIVAAVVGGLAAAGKFQESLKPPFSTGNVEFTQQFDGEKERDRFGSAVVISRDGATMAVGAEQGSYAHVFQLVDKVWKPKGEPKSIKGNTDGDQFGRCVALNQDGSILAIGGWNNDAASTDAGHAKVFWHDGTDWLPMGEPLLGSLPGDRFGWYVSLSDNGRTVAVSARLGNLTLLQNKSAAGYVRVFTYNGNLSQSNISKWKQLGSDLEGESAGDEFGKSVSLSADGRTVAVGAYQSARKKGRVQVFSFDGSLNEWDVEGKPLEGEDEGDALGTSVSLSADGAVLATAATGTRNGMGSVRVYELKNSTWTQKGKTLDGEGEKDQFGGNLISLSSNGTCLAVGASHHSGDRGKGYLFRWENLLWNKVATINGNIPGGRVGFSAAVSGDCKWFTVGAPEYDKAKVAPDGSSSKGYVRVYKVLKE